MLGLHVQWVNVLDPGAMKSINCVIRNRLDQRFSTGGTRTPRGTPAVAKGYAEKI